MNMTTVCELDIVLNDNLCNLQNTLDIMRILVICLLYVYFHFMK